jgi:hypothetical protein
MYADELGYSRGARRVVGFNGATEALEKRSKVCAGPSLAHYFEAASSACRPNECDLALITPCDNLWVRAA